MYGYYPTFHTLTSAGRKSTFSMLKICFRFSLLFYSFAVQSICLSETNCVVDINNLREEGKAGNTLEGRYIVVLCLTEIGLFQIIPLRDCR